MESPAEPMGETNDFELRLEQLGNIYPKRPRYSIQGGEANAVSAGLNALEPPPFKTKTKHVFLSEPFFFSDTPDIDGNSPHKLPITGVQFCFCFVALLHFLNRHAGGRFNPRSKPTAF